MDVRQADFEADFDSCAAIPTAVQSTHVWQMRLAYDPTTAQTHDELGATLHCTRLPRPVLVKPSSAEPFDQLWARAANVLVAEAEEAIAGYVVLTSNERSGAAVIERLIVAPDARRTGVGGVLLRTAAQAMRDSGFKTLTAHCATRNHPAANFYMRWGMRFAGYSETFYPRGEVALFWQRPV